LSACAPPQQVSQTPAGIVPQVSRAKALASVKSPASLGYGTNGLEAMPCPVKLNRKDNGSVTLSVQGPNVVFVLPIASDCVGPGSVCDLSRNGSAPTQFVVSSVRGQNLCGTAWIVFEGLTASETPIGTATVEVINKFC